MSYMKRLYEDIKVLVEDGMTDQDILEHLSEQYKDYGIALDKGDWLLSQITYVRDEMEVYD